ncbi:MAG: phage tail sheath subtilisin-like domain-containing protein [Proteobacteria bacterium]|jgi:hypothetical protein|nr:phage tail sheath subtilisin-like domain-containing protein [Pseudomonadota bacterium]
MPILRGFPPSNTISPSVRITEQDLSFIATEQTFHRAALIGFASKGPINQPTLVTDYNTLHRTFGYPHPDVGDPYLIYAAEQYLTVANELYIVRVGDQDQVSDEYAATAEIGVDAAGTQIVIQSNTAGDYVFAGPNDYFFKWSLNGVDASKTLFVLHGTYTCTELVALLNEQLDATYDGIEFFVGTGDKIGLRTIWAYGPDSSLELLSVLNDAYTVMGIGTDMVEATLTGLLAKYPDDGYTAAGTWNLTGVTNLNLQVVIDGTDSVLIDNVVQTIDLSALELLSQPITTADVVTEINDQITAGTIPGGFEASASGSNLTLTTLHKGIDARLLVKSDSTASMFGLDNSTHRGCYAVGNCEPEGVSGDAAVYTYGKVVGGTATPGTYTFTLQADSPGIEGNETTVEIVNDIREGVFSMMVYNNGVEVEAWGNLTKDQTSRFYVESYLSLVSDFVRVTDDATNHASPLDGVYTLSGGSDGIPADPVDQDTLLIGSALGYTGMFAVSEPEQIDIDMVAVPGRSSTDIVEAMIDLCQNYRMDCMGIVDPPFGLTVNEIIAWQNGTHPLNGTRFNSDFLALYWPWLKLRDTYNHVDVWIPPSGSIMAVYARNDFLTEPWFAPAGATRGIVPNITDVFSRPTLAERDAMYGNRNCINPVVQFNDLQNFVVWGQKTMQRSPTALDRVNVRRLMFVIEKQIRSQSKLMLFDPHDDEFHKKFITLASGILEQIKIGRGLYDYIIECGWDINTPDVVDRNEFRAKIGVQPVKAVEFMFIEFSIHRTGSWTENTEQPYT